MKKLMPPLAALCLIAAVTTAPAQDWPAKEPIKVIVPFTPGSATDIVARAVFNQVSQQIGQAVVVENRGGGGTTIGSAAVAHADPGRLYAIGQFDVACCCSIHLRASVL